MPFPFVFLRLRALLLALAAVVLPALTVALVATPAVAQPEPEFYDDQPYANGQWMIGRQLNQSEFRYCVDPRDASWQVDGDIADAIAQSLLLEPKRYTVPNEYTGEDLTRLYDILLQNCDVFMGFKLIPDGYPDWLTITRSYDTISYAFVTPKPEIKALSDLPPGRPVGATLGSSAHIRMVTYSMALPPEKRWPIFPFGDDNLTLAAVLDGTADVGLVWAPSFWDKQQHDPAYAGFHIVDPTPLPATSLGVGGLLLKQNTFLRAAVDQAISALIADGTIQSILDKYKYPATATP